MSIDIGTSRSGFAFSLLDSEQIHSNANGTKIPTIVLLRNPSLEFVAFGPDAKQLFDESTPEKRLELLYFANFKMCLYKAEHLPIKIKALNNQSITVDALIVFQHCLRYMMKEALQQIPLSNCKADEIKWILTVPSIWGIQPKEIMKQAAITVGIASPIMITESEAAAIYCRKTLVDQPKNGDLPDSQLTFLVTDLGGGTADFTVHRCVDTKHTNVIEVLAPSGGPWGGHTINEQFLKLLTKLFGEARMEKFQYESPSAFFELEQAFELTKTRATKSGVNVSNMCSVRLPIELIHLVPKLKASQHLGGEVELQWFIHEEQNRDSEQIITVQEDYCIEGNQNQNQNQKQKQDKKDEKDKDKEKEKEDDDDDDDEFDMNELSDEDKASVTKFLAEHKTNIWFYQDKLTFPLSMMMRFFEEPLKQIEHHLQTILVAHPEIQTTFLVGGFSQSIIVREYLQQHVFHDKVKLCTAREPQQAVLFGAVMYGCRPRQIQSRIAKYNLGISANLTITKKNRDRYKEEFKDVPRRLKLYKGKPRKWLENIFIPICRQGEALPVATPEDLKPSSIAKQKDERIWRMINVNPNNDEQTTILLSVYESVYNKRCWMSPTALANKEFHIVGCVRIPLTPLLTIQSDLKDKPRALQVWFYLGDNEIHTSVIDTRTGKIMDSKFQLATDESLVGKNEETKNNCSKEGTNGPGDEKTQQK